MRIKDDGFTFSHQLCHNGWASIPSNILIVVMSASTNLIGKFTVLGLTHYKNVLIPSCLLLGRPVSMVGKNVEFGELLHVGVLREIWSFWT